MPKSSSATPMPSAVNCSIIFIVSATSIRATPSVISMMRRSAGKVEASNSRLHQRQQPGIVELSRGEVDGHVGFGERVVGPAPLRRRHDRFVEGEGAEVQDEVALFGQRDEDARRHPSPLGVVPAHQRLEADHFAGREPHDRLVVHGQVTRRRWPVAALGPARID